MAFLNPILLFGLTAISVPIIIHLLSRRQFKRVVWAAMRFLKISVEANQRRMNLEDLLLLLLRCLLVLLLALTLARPALQALHSQWLGQSKTTAVLLLDNSASMSQTDGIQSRFEQARKASEDVIDALPSGSSVAVYLVSDIFQGVVPEPSADLNLARKAVREARLSSRATDILPALTRAVDMLHRHTGSHKEIFLITDDQALGWGPMAQIQKTLNDEKTNNLRTHLIFVGGLEEHNLGVSDLRLASGLVAVQQPLRFEVKVTNYSRADVRDVPVRLSVDGEPPMDEAILQSLLAGESKSVSLFVRLHSEGYHTVTAQLPEDHMPADNHRTVAVRAIKSVKVLLVDGHPGREARDSEVFFLRNTLSPVPQAQAEQYFIKTVTVGPTALETLSMDDYEAVILANVTDFSQTTLTAFAQYLRRGGGLIFFPGSNTNLAFYNEQLLGRYEFLPASFGPARGQADQQEKFFSLQDKNYEHPVVSIWNDSASGTLATARFFRAITLQPATKKTATPPKSPTAAENPAGDPKIILRFSDQTPALMERPWGQGKVVLASSSANTAWNDLPVRVAFLPLVHRLLGNLVQSQDEALNVKVGQKFVFHPHADLLGKDAVFTNPGTKEVTRDLRKIEMVQGQPVLQYEETDLGGAYEVAINADPPLTLRFAAQADPAESNLTPISKEEMDALGQVAQVSRWSADRSLKDMLVTERTGTELWKPLVLLTLILAMTETYLAQKFSRSK